MRIEDQYEDFEKYMNEKYPKMFSHPYGGIDIGIGWHRVIESLCGKIQSHLDWANKQAQNYPVRCQPVEQVVVHQIKEKFGGLRFYYHGGDEQVSGMVRMAEVWAENACETCGSPATLRSDGWLRTLCDDHEAERQDQIKARCGDE